MSLSTKEIEIAVREIIERMTGLEPNEVKFEDHFYQELGIDSIKGIELVVALQEKFKIRLDDSKIPEMVNIKLVVEELQRLLDSK